MEEMTDTSETEMPEEELKPLHGGLTFQELISLRVTAADIASRLPWNASEAVTNKAITDRFDVVLGWITK